MSTETEDSHDDHGHHLPAVEDWPRGFGEASWWPFVTAVGGAGIYVGAALWLLSEFVGSMVGPVVAVGSIGLFLVGIFGWVYHAFVSKFWTRDRSEHGPSSLRWGMWAFLGSELATFGAVFGYYFYVRAGTWPPSGETLPPLLSSLIVANTLILVASSFTLHWAEASLQKGDRTNFLRGMAVTLVLGVVFLAGQALEYFEFIAHEGLTLQSGIFASAFFGLTGLHGLHVSLGAVFLGIVFVRALYGQYSAERHLSVSTASLYWHFVDAVWIFLVVVLYVGAVV